jgi:hypothetical protein
MAKAQTIGIPRVVSTPHGPPADDPEHSMKSLLFLTDLDQSALARALPGVEGAGGRRAPDAASAAAGWLGAPMPAPPAVLRLRGETPPAAPAGEWLACMDPVSMAADMRELHLLDDAPALAAEEASALRRSILPSLTERGLSLQVGAPGRWYVAAAEARAFTAAAPAVARAGRIRDELPTGPDAGEFRALGNEVQMLWHDHPVNAERAGRGLAPVNSVWFWGGGRVGTGSRDARRLPPLYAADPLLRGLWLEFGATPAPPPAGEEAARALAAGAVMALPGAALDDPPLRRALRRGRVAMVTRDGLVCVPPRRGLRALLAGRWRR